MKKENIRIFTGGIIGTVAISTLALVLSNTNPFKRDYIETYGVTTIQYEMNPTKRDNMLIEVAQTKQYLSKYEINDLNKEDYKMIEFSKINYDDIQTRLQTDKELIDEALFLTFMGLGGACAGMLFGKQYDVYQEYIKPYQKQKVK